MEWWPPDRHSVQLYRNGLQCLACLKCCLAVCVPVTLALFQCHLPNLALSTESTWLFAIRGLDFQVLHSPFPPYHFPLFSKLNLSFLQACLFISLISARELLSFPPSCSLFAYIFPLCIQTRIVPLLSFILSSGIHIYIKLFILFSLMHAKKKKLFIFM